jgi:hypothetical protein
MGANETHHKIDLVIELHDLYLALGRDPRAKDIDEAHTKGSIASYTTFCHHFGSRKNAVKEMKRHFGIPEEEPVPRLFE